MPGSRSAKEICRSEGPGSISCRVASEMEARRAREDAGSGPATPPAAAPQPPAPKPGAPSSPFNRGSYLEDQIRKAGG